MLGGSHACLRCHYISERFPAVPGSADDRQVHSAVVWRVGGGVERGVAVLPVAAFGWLSICASADQVRFAEAAGAGAWNPAGIGADHASDYSLIVLEASGRRRSDI